MAVVLNVNLKDILLPEQLPELIKTCQEHIPEGGREGLIISGRLPVWAFASLVHLYHPRPWVATFDPRLNGGVVVESHCRDVRVGEIVPMEGETITVEF